MENKEQLIDTLRRKLEADDPQAIRETAEEFHPASLAEALLELPLEELGPILFYLLPRTRAEVFGHFPLETQRDLTALLDVDMLAELVSQMPHDERVDFLQKITPERSEDLLRLVARSERDDIRRLAAYEEGTAGAIMTSEYAALPPDITIAEALRRLREAAPDRETIYEVFVIDTRRRLVGQVSLKDIILGSPGTRIEDIMRSEVPFVRVMDPQEEVAQKISKYDMIAIPVINGGDALVGIVTFDDAFDVAEAEATESIHRIGSVGQMSATPKEARTGLLVRARIPWLLALVFVNILSGAGIASFEEVIKANVVLVFFLPLLIASGGNAGAQAATLMVRSLGTGDVKMKDWLSLLRKEAGVAAILGLLMGVAVSTIGFFRGGIHIAAVVAVTMVIVVLVGSIIGMLLPFVLEKYGLDPATASAPLVTSLADISGVLIYLSIATWYLGLVAL